MLLSKLKSCGAVCALSLAILVAGCTVSPVYDGNAENVGRLTLSYAAPTSRLEQDFYQELSKRLPSGGVPVGEIRASVAVSSSKIGLSSVSSPITDYQIVARVTYAVTRGGSALVSGERRATAGYQRTGQKVADDAARNNAEEQAVRAAAEQVRLALMADLTPQ